MLQLLGCYLEQSTDRSDSKQVKCIAVKALQSLRTTLLYNTDTCTLQRAYFVQAQRNENSCHLHFHNTDTKIRPLIIQSTLVHLSNI